MTNPRNLQELADSLAVSARMAEDRKARRHAGDPSVPMTTDYWRGYAEALLDQRSTVLAMIQQVLDAERTTLHEANEADDGHDEAYLMGIAAGLAQVSGAPLPDRPQPAEVPEHALVIYPPDAEDAKYGDNHFTVTGDLREIRDDKDDSTNYLVVTALLNEGAENAQGVISIEAEYSAFYAYTVDLKAAEALRDRAEALVTTLEVN